MNTHYTQGPARRTVLSGAVTLALAAVLGLPAAAQDGSVLTVVPSSDLAILDPVWTTAQITGEHSFLIYDTLFSIDSAGMPQLQMLESSEVSEDGLTYTFTLREGLLFHDGSPVESADAVASIQRWSKRRPDGQMMDQYGAEWAVVDPRTFTLTLAKPYSNVEAGLGDNARPAFIMREEDASTDAFEQITTAIGSGPFMFDAEAWRPGSAVVYHKFDDYIPREEPSDGFAGGKIAGVDTIEWTVIPDSATAVNALIAGEVDMVINPTPDLLPLLQADPNIETETLSPIGFQGMLRFNSLAAPLDKAPLRQAINYVVQYSQEEFLSAMVGIPDNYMVCLTPMVCGSPYETDVGTEQFTEIDLPAKVGELLEAGGYADEPIVVLDPTDQQAMHNMVLVLAQKLREVGFTVDLQATDWGTVTKRRTNKAGPAEDPTGYHIFPTWWGANSMQNPITNLPLNTAPGGDNWYGWPSDETLEELRLSFADARTEDEKQQIVDDIQTRFFEVVPYVWVGQYFAPMGYRSDRVEGIVKGGTPVYWNISRID